MKKLLMAAVLSSVLLVNGAFANKETPSKNDNVNYQVQAAFNHEFAQVKNVSWQKKDNFYKAVFMVNKDVVNAYFTPEGELLGTIRNILSTQLPINLRNTVSNDYDGYWISELFEFSKPNSFGYFITLQNADEVVTLESRDGVTWSTYSKSKKQ